MTDAGTEPMLDLTAHECWDRLRSTQVGRLAIVTPDGPDLFPVNYVVDHGTVVFRTAQGSKLAGSTHGALVAFEADGLDSATSEAWSVVIKARGEALAQHDELVDTLNLPLFPWHGPPKPFFVRLVPHAVTGRRFVVADPSRWSGGIDATPI